MSEATTIIIVNDDARSEFGMLTQDAEGDYTTATFDSLEGAHFFIDECLTAVKGIGLCWSLKSFPHSGHQVVYHYKTYEKTLGNWHPIGGDNEETHPR